MGNHMTILSEPQVHVVAKRLLELLERARVEPLATMATSLAARD
jgi:thioesterase domain-containing protein